jgi:hypothetical protein
MMVIDFEIALSGQFQIEKAVARETLEHMVEKGHAAMDFTVSGAIELEGRGDLGLARAALDRRDTRWRRAGFLFHRRDLERS